MDRDFSHIVGEIRQGEPATIRFYGKITEESAARFNGEFDYLESQRPSLIRVLINCEGGSVLHGMSSYATIQNSTVPTECVNEGMAASMGSVLWAAGGRSLMRDYAILMIHNPFLPSDDGGADEMVLAFTKQIRTIYRKRFGLSEKHIEAIMTGEAGKDGTFFDAESAVKAGIIPQENILSTTPQLRDKVRVELSALENAADIRSMMGRISAEAATLDCTCKPSAHTIPTLRGCLDLQPTSISGSDRGIFSHCEGGMVVPLASEQSGKSTGSETESARDANPKHPLIQTSKSKEMSTENKTLTEYSAVAATLGMKDDFQPKDVMARISELLSTETRFRESEKALSDAQTVIAGRDATIKNLTKELGEATASLATYQKRETDEKTARIESMVEAAITAGKIDRASKADWVTMAEANLSLAENTLASIPAREQISKEIAADPANVKAATEAAKTTEGKLAEQVAQVVGEKFEFKKIG